jgi:hypothetical protein
MVTDIPYMTLSGPDCEILLMLCDLNIINWPNFFVIWIVEPSREHIFYVTFPQNWKLQDIFHLFSVHGKLFTYHNFV